MHNQSINDERSFIKKLINTGTSFVDKPADKRNTIIANYFSIVLFSAIVILLLIRYIFFNSLPDSGIVSAAIFFLIPLLLNRFGFLFLAKIALCWLPSIAVMFIYITNGIKSPSSILASDYDSHRLYLLGFAAVPYLLLNLSNTKELIIGLSLPFITVLFSYQIMNAFGLSHLYENKQGYGYTLIYFRTTLAYLVISGCCISMRLLVEREDRRNTMLIEELEEKNKLIDQRAEEEIRKSENMYRELFEQGADAITLVDNDRKFKRVNSKACEMFGYSEEEFLSLNLEDIIAPQNLVENPVDLEALKTYKTVLRERILIRKDRTVFPAEINVRMLANGSFQSFIRDVSERKKAEQELMEAESKFRTLIEQSLIGVYIIVDGRFGYVNPQFAQIFGYTQEELIHSYAIDIVVHPDDIARVNENVRIRMAGEKDSIRYEAKGRKKNGEVIQMEIFGSKALYGGRPAIIGVLLDMTENKLLQQQVLEQRIQEQKKITRAVLEAEEKERNRIGQELHDNVNQILAGTRLYLELAAKDDKNEKKLITNSLELINQAIEEMRSLSKSQVTPFKGTSLEDLIYLLVEKLCIGSSIETKINYSINNQLLEDGLKLNIYRIIQEQITNILKHANASQITISLKDDLAFIYISIEDNGKGFDPEQKRNGIGVSNMLNRVESFNGELRIDSSPGNGCSLQIKVPY